MLRCDRIAALLEAGERDGQEDPFVITPMPNLTLLRNGGGASIDLRLGTWFVHLKKAQTTSITAESQKSSALSKTNFVPFGKPYILHPQSFVLAVTLEWIRLPNNLTASVVGKSSWGRYGLIIATATGVHPGFKGCLTLELCNVGEIPIEITPGIPICQLFVQELATTDDEHAAGSSFEGTRKPMFRPIVPDAVARKLSRDAWS